MKDWGDSLLTRSTGKKIRDVITEEIKDIDVIELDFEGVKNATQGFLDESIAKLLFIVNVSEFMEKVKFKNTNPKIEAGIKFVVSERIHNLCL